MKKMVCILVFALSAAFLFADTVTMNDGRVFEGSVVSSTGSFVQLMMTFNKSDVKDIFIPAPDFKKPIKRQPTVHGNFEVTEGYAIDTPIDTTRFANVARRVLRNRKYVILSDEPGVITYRLDGSNWNLIMRLCYYSDEYWYEYVSSSNLDADPVRNRIHRNFPRWIQNLEHDLAKEY